MNNNLAENLKYFRKKKKLSQAALGMLIDKSLSTIQKYESGDISPPLEVLKEIADMLGVYLIDLIGQEEIYRREGIKLDSNLVLDNFDPFIIAMFKKFKEKFETAHPHVEISNSSFIQSIITDYIARYEADMRVYKSTTIDDFLIIENNRIKIGKDHYDILYDRYFREKMNDFKRESLEHIELIVRRNPNGITYEGDLQFIKGFVKKYGVKSLPIEARMALENSSKGVD